MRLRQSASSYFSGSVFLGPTEAFLLIPLDWSVGRSKVVVAPRRSQLSRSAAVIVLPFCLRSRIVLSANERHLSAAVEHADEYARPRAHSLRHCVQGGQHLCDELCRPHQNCNCCSSPSAMRGSAANARPLSIRIIRECNSSSFSQLFRQRLSHTVVAWCGFDRPQQT